MPNKIRHLRGTEQEWAAYDAVLEDGEIGLSKTPTGRYKIKIGNGTNKFSELESFGKEVTEPISYVVNLKHAQDVRLGERATVNIYLPQEYDSDFYAILSFDSGEAPTSMRYVSGKIRFSGHSVIGREFVPMENVHYTMLFWYDGEFQCHIRGVDNV